MNNKERASRFGSRFRILPLILCAVMVLAAVTPGDFGVGSYAAEAGIGLQDLGQMADGAGENALGSVEASEPESTSEAEGTPGMEGAARVLQSLDGTDLRTYAAKDDWYFGVARMESQGLLETTKQSTDYNGNVTTKTYRDEPSPGMRFVVVNLALTKTLTGGSSFAADDITLTVNGNTYSRELNDGFLLNHNYAAFPNSPVLAGSKTGDIVFQVNEEDSILIASWKEQLNSGAIILSAGEIHAVAAEANEDEMVQVPLGGYLVDSQFQAEMELMATYGKGSYGITDPLIVRDPYNLTPLTALAMFHTDRDAAKIQVTVKGKDSAADTVYEVETSGKEHQVPIYTLYAKHQNSIVLQALDEAGEQIGRSGVIADKQLDTVNISGYEAIAVNQRSKSLPMEPGFVLLWTEHMVMIDYAGEIRWYQSMGVGGESGANKITDRGTIYFTDRCNGRIGNPSIVYEMNWSGKIIAQYQFIGDADGYPDAHHDLDESSDGSQILFGINNDIASNAIRVVDKNTGATLKKLRMSEIISKTDSGDWSHLNTITMLPDEPGVYLLSLRNQDLVMKYDLTNDEVIWAFSYRIAYHRANNPRIAGKLITLDMNTADRNGKQPEWFYHQHEITMLPDQDGEDSTEDILLFDNGVTRPGSEQYSRVVHYRIDLKDKTAKQIYSAKQTYSAYYGGAELLPETGNYTATGASHVYTQYSPKAEVVFSVTASAGTGGSSNGLIYRSFHITTSDMTKGFAKLGTLKGKAFMNIGEEAGFTPCELPENVESRLSGGIDKVFVHDQQLLIAGSGYLNSGAAKSVFLVADDGKNLYRAPLLSNSMATRFDSTVKTGVPLSISSLPQGRYNLGIWVKEGNRNAYKTTNYYIEKTGVIQRVQTDDEGQREIVEELISKSQDSANSLTNPVIVVNPFDKAPLSAAAAFHTAKPCTVTVTVKGKPLTGDMASADVTYTVSGDKTTNHVVPIIGLYADYENTVELRTSEGKLSVLRVKTQAVNETLTREAEITASAEQRTSAAQGLTFLTPAGAQTVPMAIDINGELRWVYMCAAAAPVETKPLSDGHFLVPSDRPSAEIFVTDAETVLEIDLLGRIYGEYFLDGMPHHEVFERENGNLIFALSKRNSTSIEDYMVEVERQTGTTLRTWDFRKIFGIPEYDASYDEERGAPFNPDAPHRAHPSIVAAAGNHPYSDWFHQNSLYYDEGNPRDPADDAIYVTARHQSLLAKVNAEKSAGENPLPEAVEWIYTDPSWLPQSSIDLKSLVLSPKGETSIIDEPAAVNKSVTDIDSPANLAATLPVIEEPTAADPAVDELAVEIPEPAEAVEPAAEISETAEVEEPAAEMPETAEAAEPAAKTTEAIKSADANEGLTEPSTDSMENSSPNSFETAEKAAPGGSSYPYIYGPHAVERISNGDFIVYDNHLYGSKTTMMQDASGLFSRALRLHVDEEDKTFEIQWEYGQELGSDHYTPFIGDVDYLGAPATESGQITDEHYLIAFGGITKNAAGEACDVVAAMMGGSISADIREYRNGEILWRAYLKGSAGKVSSVYRAERVDLSSIPVQASDYIKYASIENRGMYTNTPQANDEVNNSILNRAQPGTVPVSWKLLQDEGNRLVGTFTLPHILTDAAGETEKIKNIYVVLNMGGGKTRVYEADFVAAIPALGVKEGYYKFEIMKDNRVAQIQLLLERTDGIWILGDTGEVASADMKYATGEEPVVDPVQAAVDTASEADSMLVRQLAELSGASAGCLVLVDKGALQPGFKYVYTDSDSGEQAELLYSAPCQRYIAFVNKSVNALEAASGVSAVRGVVTPLRTGVIANGYNNSVNGLLRTAILPEDVFYLQNQLENGTLPYRELSRTLAMDITGDYEITPIDLSRLILIYMAQ